MNELNPELIDAVTFASNKPELPAKYEERDELVELINSHLRNGVSTLVLIGNAQLGKSCLLYEFCRANLPNTVALFFTGVAGYSFSPSYIRYELYTQLNWILARQFPDPSVEPTDVQVESLFMRAQREFQTTGTPINIVVDGIYEGELRTPQAIETVKRLVPMGLREFHVLISAQLESQVTALVENTTYRRVDLPPLSRRAADRLLDDLVLDENLRKDLISSCRSEPGKLSILRRILTTSASPHDLAENLVESAPDLFAYEWKQNKPSSPALLSVLALLAYQPGNTLFDAIVRRANADPDELRAYLATAPFLELGEDSHINFISDSYRLYAKTQLTEFEESARENVIDDLLSQPSSPEALADMPRHFSEAGRDSELFRWLNSRHLFEITKSVSSLHACHSQLDIGIDKSVLKNDLSTSLELTTRRSLLTDIPTSSVLRSELRAALSLDQTALAHNLLASATLKEDKLELLAIAAHHLLKNAENLEAYDSLKHELDTLANQIDPKTLSIKRAAQIARAIFPLDAELAISLVKNANAKDFDGPNSEELFRFSLTTLDETDKTNRKDALKHLRDALPDSTLPNVEAAAALFAASDSIEHFVQELTNLTDKSDALTIAQFWCTTNAESKNALPVISFAVETALVHTSFNPTCSFYSAILKPLKFSAPHAEVDVRKIARIIDGQSDTLKAYGPTYDYVAAQLRLAEAEYSYDHLKAKERIFDVYLEIIAPILDSSVKASCLSQICDAIAELDATADFETEDQFNSLVWDELETAIAATISETASHEEALKRTVEALSKNFLAFSVSLSQRLNTVERRDHSCAAALCTHLDTAARPDFHMVAAQIPFIHGRTLREDVLLHACYALVRPRENWQAESVLLRSWIELAKTLTTIEGRIEALAKLASYGIKKQTLAAEELNTLKEDITHALNSVDIYWLKLRYAFSLAEWFADADRDLSNSYFSRAIDLRSESNFEVFDISDSVLIALNLAIKTLPLVSKDKNSLTRCISRITTEIRRIPSVGYQAIFFAELSLTLSLNSQLEQASTVISRHVLALLVQLKADNENAYSIVGARICPALWFAHRTTFNQVIADLDFYAKDKALLSVARTIVRRISPLEPYSSFSDKLPPLEYSVIKDLLYIAEQCVADNAVYSILADTCKIIEQSRSKRELNRNQLVELIRNIRAVAEAKFPAPGYIQHEGYNLVTEASLGLIERGKHVDWPRLEQEARKIANLADRTYVLTIIAESMPGKRSIEAKRLLADVEDLVRRISCNYDKLTRYETLARSAQTIDPSVSKRALREAFNLSYVSDDPELEERRRTLIDLADRISPDLPDQLIGALDDDPARTRERGELKEHLELIKSSGEIGSTDLPTDWFSKKANRIVAQMCWRHLAAVNADRRLPLEPARLISLVATASKSRIKEVYPIYALAIRSLVIRNSETTRDTDFLGFDFVESITDSAALLSRILALGAGDVDGWFRYEEAQGKDVGKVIHPGEQDKGQRVLRDWLVENEPETLRIIDPYFTVSDLELLNLIHKIVPSCSIEIVTSEEAQKASKVEEPWSDTYSAVWRRLYSDTAPADCVVTVLGFGPQGKSPFHDRWWLSDTKGLRLGTSTNGLGASRVSEVSMLNQDDVSDKQRHSEEYLSRKTKYIDGKKIRRHVFTIA